MYYNINECIANGWITGDISLENIQPNALDFTVDDIFELKKTTNVVMTNDADEVNVDKELTRVDIIDLRDYRHLYGHHTNLKDRRIAGWVLEPNKTYYCTSRIGLRLPENIFASLVVRSTFNRNGIYIASHIHTSDDNKISFLVINNGTTCIEQGTRIGQVLISGVNRSEDHPFLLTDDELQADETVSEAITILASPNTTVFEEIANDADALFVEDITSEPGVVEDPIIEEPVVEDAKEPIQAKKSPKTIKI